MFTNRVLSKMNKVQYVTVNMDKIPSHYNIDYFKSFDGKRLLLLGEPRDIEDDCLCLFKRQLNDGMPILYSSAFDTIINILESDTDWYRLYTKNSINKYLSEDRIYDYFGAGFGIVGIDRFILDNLNMQKEGKNLLDRL